MYKAYKFRIYPDEKQTILINKSFGCARFVYNYYLSKIIKESYINANTCIKDYVNWESIWCYFMYFDFDSSILYF